MKLRRTSSAENSTSTPPKGIVIGTNTTIVNSGSLDKRAPESQMTIGDDCLIEGMLVTETNESRLRLGNNVYVGTSTVIDCALDITVQNDVLISYQCIITDSDNHSSRYSLRKNDLQQWRTKQRDWTHTPRKPVLIKQGAWLGARCVVVKGVTIGEGAIVGVGSVVTKDVPDWTVVGGNPAQVLRTIPENER